MFPYLESDLQRARDQGYSGEGLEFWYIDYCQLCLNTLGMYKSAYEIDAGLELLSLLNTRLAAGRKAGEFTQRLETESSFKSTIQSLKKLEAYFNKESAMHR